jgi:hypothetical protein
MNKGYKDFIEENLKIVNKEGELVDFVLNDVQRKFITEDITGRDIVLKARQQGFSSVILGLYTADFLLKEHTFNVVVADDTDNAKGLLKRVKDFVNFWCEANGLEAKNILRYNSKYELYFEEMDSTYVIGTAQNTNFGRSKTITNLHLSEAAFYPHFREIIAGAMQAVVPTGRAIIETTANGFNEFKTYWDETKRGETSFTGHFYPAQDFYSADFLTQKETELGRLFKQEYPRSPQDAFITSGDNYFSQDALEYYLRAVKEPIKEGVIYV